MKNKTKQNNQYHNSIQILQHPFLPKESLLFFQNGYVPHYSYLQIAEMNICKNSITQQKHKVQHS